VLYKDFERVLANNSSEISIKQSIKAINKMYEIIIPLPNNTYN
jgi:hypothetical protein